MNQRLLPFKCNLDLAAEKMQPDTARFIKNLTPYVTANPQYGIKAGYNELKQKTLQSNFVYCNVDLPTDGINYKIGDYESKATNAVYIWVYNTVEKHLIYKIDGNTQTSQVIYSNSNLNFNLDPKNFIHKGGAYLEIIYLTDPDTNLPKQRTLLMFTDGINPQRQICIEDSIATNSFNASLFPYFKGNYDRESLINMGIATPKNCISIAEIPRQLNPDLPDYDGDKINKLLFNTWQFRISIVDVYGRPSEHCIISDLYVPGINDCISGSNSLARCLLLTINAGNPLWDKMQIEYRNCNSQQWYISDTLELYLGSSLGAWWLRQRNPDIPYDFNTNTIQYRFCADHEKIAIAPTETDRLYNPLPKISQSLAKVGEYITLWNNVDGFQPTPLSEKKKIQVTVEPPAQVDIKARTITIYVPIYNEALRGVDPVWQQVHPKQTNVGYKWGSILHGAEPINYKQVFSNQNQSGFIGYLNNGNYTISTQVYVDAAGNLIDDPEHQGYNLSPTHLTFQKFVFTNIPAGNYVFRLAASTVNPLSNENFSQTSTSVWGICPFNKQGYSIETQNRTNSYELDINVCNADYDSMNDSKMLVIADLCATVSGDDYKAICGYMYETQKNGFNQYPVELAQEVYNNGYGALSTDHNGFFYYNTRGAGRHFGLYFYNNCQKVNFSIAQSETAGATYENIIVDERQENGNPPAYPDFSIMPCNHILVTGTIILADKNLGVPNLSITLTRGQSTTTDDNGNFTIVAHDDVLNGVRNDELIFTGIVCNYTGIDNSCLSVKNITITPCTGACVERKEDTGITTIYYNQTRSLLSGGSYGIGFTRYDKTLGRATYIQDLGIINIPTINQSKAIGASKVRIKIPADFKVDTDTDYITFSLTRELNYETYIDWIVDQIKFIDNTGQENDLAPTQIKIYYGSLNAYNANNNYNTTTNWQFLEPLPANSATTTTQTPYTTDIVQFFINGDGTFFPQLITVLVKYDQTGQYFLIDYTSDLANLKQNALIRLARPRTSTSDTEIYYEICKIIPVVNGAPTITDFYLDAYDTYYLNRQIPVPAVVDPQPTTASVTTTVTNGDTSVATTEIPAEQTIAYELRNFAFAFESDSPSNFWGEGCKNIGRQNVKNAYEAEIVRPEQVALSGVLSPNGQLNYLNYFDDKNKKTFPVAMGGVVAALPELNIVEVIGQLNNFVVGFNDNLARANEQGAVYTQSIDNKFGNPQTKVGNNYGCKFEDKNTIQHRNGLISWADRSRGEWVQFNFQQVNTYTKDKCDIWCKSKFISVQKSSGQRYLISGINPLTNEIYFTDFSLANPSYINTERQEQSTVSETISFDLASRDLNGWFSATPEGYAFLEGDIVASQFFSFKNAVPYAHYNLNTNNSFNVFYGVPCLHAFRVLGNQDFFKKKMFLAISVYCVQQNHFADVIYTDDNQQSRILLDNWTKEADFYFAPFLCDLNTPTDPNYPLASNNKLTDGNKLTGSFIDVRLVSDPAKLTQYAEISGVTIEMFNYEKSG